MIGASALPEWVSVITSEYWPAPSDGAAIATVSPAVAASAAAWMVQNGAARLPAPVSEQFEEDAST